jgi:hypothetical protein
MNKRRLNTMIRFLETSVKASRFNLRGFGHGCGTAGCVGGWTPAVPAFRKLGVQVYDPSGQVPAIPMLPGKTAIALGRRAALPERYASIGLGVLEILFDISLTEANWLFLASSYPGRRNPGLQTVIKRMKAFVAGTKKPPINQEVTSDT